jgi:outer membrane protein OmpA-like peptidoglycan-associated protein
MMPAKNILPHIGVTIALALFAAGPAPAQTPPTRDDIVNRLNRFDTAPDFDLAALRQQVLERAKTRIKNDPGPVNRPPVAPDLAKLASFATPVQFDADTPIIQPASYQTIGRIADALVHASLLPYTFLIVGHIESTGRREANLILSQRRADAVRDVLVNTFKISAKRIQSIGLGEEQLLDPAHPTAAANGQLQILTLSKLIESDQPPAASPPPAAKKPAKKKK